ncbi:PilZ domain-containing protein [Megalodesulfovibrio paquesii]
MDKSSECSSTDNAENYSPGTAAVEYSGAEKRCSPRTTVHLNALVQSICERGRTFIAKPVIIKDISLAGARIHLSAKSGIEFIRDAQQLEIIIQLPQGSTPVSFHCSLRHATEQGDSLVAGLDFINSSFSDYKRLALLYGH